jgi:hypothetical protein
MNQASLVPFGTDASRLAGYAQTANERLGAIDFIFENTGSIPAYILVQQYVGPTTSPSGYSAQQPNQAQSINYTYVSTGTATYTPLGAAFIVAAKGCITRSYNLLSQRVGFFGSGIATALTGIINGVFYNNVTFKSTTVNITAVIRNPSDIRGAQIDISQVGRQGWGYDQAFNTPNLTKQWGFNSTTGIISSNSANYDEAAST